jgi:NLI interacting factor-like phosphatase
VPLFQESYLAHASSLAQTSFRSMLGAVSFVQPVTVAFRSTRCRVVRNESSSSSDALRLFSSWVTPSQRRKRVGVGSPYYQPHPERGHGASSHPSVNAVARRPLVNGKSVAFHVKDLQQQTSEPAQSTYFDWNPLATTANGTASTSRRSPPPVERRYESDLIVLLDLDECLVHTQFTGTSPTEASLYAHQMRRRNEKSLNGNNNNGESLHGSTVTQLDSFRVHLPNDTLAHVTLRPGVIDFLSHVTARYETHIFTAATEIYANPVLDTLCASVQRQRRQQGLEKETSTAVSPPMPIFSGRWYRTDCIWDAAQKAFVKDLSRLPLFHDNKQLLQRAILVDNNPRSFLQLENGILVDSFYDDASDTTLPTVRDFLDRLNLVSDVRPVIRELWHSFLALQEHAVQEMNATRQSHGAGGTRGTATPPPPPAHYMPQVSSQHLIQNLSRRISL